jgi:hypothetical protein
MTDLIALGYGSDAAAILACGHARTMPPGNMYYYRWLFTNGTETVCMECPFGDDRRLIIDLITRRG